MNLYPLNILLLPTPGPVHTQSGRRTGCEQRLVVVVVEVVSIVIVVSPDHVEDGHHVPGAEADVVLRAAARADEGVVCQEVGGRPRPPSGRSPGHQVGLHWSGCGPHLDIYILMPRYLHRQYPHLAAHLGTVRGNVDDHEGAAGVCRLVHGLQVHRCLHLTQRQ